MRKNMKKLYCDICGKEIKRPEHALDYGRGLLFHNLDDEPITDVCTECHNMIYCCINMMRQTSWKPCFATALKDGTYSFNDMEAEHVISELEDRTGLSLW